MSNAGKVALLPPRGLLLSLLAQVPLIVWFWPLSPPLWMALSGASFLLFGVVMNIWAYRLFRQGGVGVCPFSPTPQLVHAGPYRLTRNPMYLGMIFLSAGVVLVTGVPLNLWSPAAFAVWLHQRFVLPEEGFLRERLGSAYEDYWRNRPRWLGIPSTR